MATGVSGQTQISKVFFIATTPRRCPELSDSQLVYFQELSSIAQIDSILDQGETQSKVKALGQKLFDEFKDASDGNSLAGMGALITLCDAIYFSGSEGPLERDYIERAWKGVGDSNWRWMALSN